MVNTTDETAHSRSGGLALDLGDGHLQHDLAALNVVGWALSQSLDIDRLLIQTLETTLPVMGSPAGAVYLLPESGAGGFRLSAQVALVDGLVKCSSIVPRDDPDAQEIIKSGEPVAVRWCDLSRRTAEAESSLPVSDRDRHEYWIGFPLMAHDQLQGLMVILGDAPAPDQAAVMRAISQQVGMAIDHARRYMRAHEDALKLRRETGRWSTFDRATVAVSNARSEQEVYDTITQALSELGYIAAISAVKPQSPAPQSEAEDRSLVG